MSPREGRTVKSGRPSLAFRYTLPTIPIFRFPKLNTTLRERVAARPDRAGEYEP